MSPEGVTAAVAHPVPHHDGDGALSGGPSDQGQEEREGSHCWETAGDIITVQTSFYLSQHTKKSAPQHIVMYTVYKPV